MAVAITSYTGTKADGESIVITGTGFGTNALSNFEWLGGASGNIESGTVGSAFTKTGWSNDVDYPAVSRAPDYSNTKAHSGTKSIISSYLSDTYDSGIVFDTGGNQSSIYLSYWAYFDWAALFDGQWKTWRLTSNGTYSTAASHIMDMQWYNTGADDGTMNDNYLYDNWNGVGHDATDLKPSGISINKWAMAELYYVQETGGLSNGKLTYSIYNQDVAVDVARDVSNLDSNPINLRWVGLQNYLGNLVHGDRTLCSVYVDDVFIQWGTPARVMLCKEATWAARKHAEIQIPTAWSNTEITFTLNQGSFGAEDTYLYVIDSAGVVNANGTLLSFGGDLPVQTPPLSLMFLGVGI